MSKAGKIEKHHQKILTEFQRLIEKWKPVLGLHRHEIVVVPTKDKDDDYTASINTESWEYHNAVIKLNMKSVDELEAASEWDTEQTVVHELIHVVTAPIIHSLTDLINYMTSPSNNAITTTMYNVADKHCEALCETLANAFLAIKRDK